MTRLTVRRGSTGSIVIELQRKLNSLGYYHGGQHGTFDADTEKAVISMQLAAGLKADGNVDTETWAVLNNKRNKAQPPSAPPLVRSNSTSVSIKDFANSSSRIIYSPKQLSAPNFVNTGTTDTKKTKNNESGVVAFRDKVSKTFVETPEPLIPVSFEPDQYTATPDRTVAALNPKRDLDNEMPTVDTVADLSNLRTGNTEQTLQMMLHILGYYNGRINGIFDSASEQAVAAFQRDNGFDADGVVTSDIWAALDNAITVHMPTPSSYTLSDSDTRCSLRPGDTGETVQVLQMMLQLLDYYDGPVNSVFDATTRQAVTAFQNGSGLLPNGAVDSQTWEQLDNAMLNLPPMPAIGHSEEKRPSLLPGDSGEAVKVLQMMLYILGYYDGHINSIFCDRTKQAVIDFQKNSGLVPANIVGSATWEALNNAMIEHVPASPFSHLQSPLPTPSNSLSLSSPKHSALSPRDSISLCWVQNPARFAISTDAFNVISPVWYDLVASGESLEINPRNASADFTQTAHEKGLSVWGTIQSFDAQLTRRLVTSYTEITQFISKMKAFCAVHQLDGICIDFEHMYVEDKDKFTEFVRRMSAELKSDAASRNQQFVISVCFTIPPNPDDQNNMWSACVDRAALGLICDYCCLMLYDESDLSSGEGSIASHSWAIEGLRRTLEQVSHKTLLLGVPFYSVKWSSQTGSAAMYLTMDMIQSLLDNESFTDRSGSTIKVSQYIVRPTYQDGELYTEFVDTADNTHKIWAHTPQSVSTRIALAAENNLPGAAFWEYSYSNEAVWEVARGQLGNL